MRHYGNYAPEVKALIVTALSIANADFLIDTTNTTLIVNKDHATPQHLNLIKQFLRSRVRFLEKRFEFKGKVTEKVQVAFDRKLAGLACLVHLQSACPFDMYKNYLKFNDLPMLKQVINFCDNIKGVLKA